MSDCFDRCLALNPSFARAWFASGQLRLFAGQPNVALEHFDTSLRLSPRDRQAFYLIGIGNALFFNHRFDDAAAKLIVSLEQLPTFALTYRLLASCYAHMGRLDDARENRHAAAGDHLCRDTGPQLPTKRRTPRVFPVGPALSGWRGDLRRSRNVAIDRPFVCGRRRHSIHRLCFLCQSSMDSSG